tara:strand:+ start:41 stop:532 length:492 start_codon:yes stop_codon:yes gene_type:complete
MLALTMEIKQLYAEQIKKTFMDYYGDNFQGGDFDDFKNDFVEEIYNYENDDITGLVKEHLVIKEFSHLVFFLKLVKEHTFEIDLDFKDWDEPEKVWKLGLYCLAYEVLNLVSQEDLGQQEEEETNPFNNDTLWKEHGKADLPYWNRLLDEAEDKVRLLKYMKP